MSDHGIWKKNFPEVVRVAHVADCKYDDFEMKLSGTGPWDLGVARRQWGCPGTWVCLAVSFLQAEVAGLTAYHAPGHSEGSVFYASSKLSALFTGEPCQLHSSVEIHSPTLYRKTQDPKAPNTSEPLSHHRPRDGRVRTASASGQHPRASRALLASAGPGKPPPCGASPGTRRFCRRCCQATATPCALPGQQQNDGWNCWSLLLFVFPEVFRECRAA